MHWRISTTLNSKSWLEKSINSEISWTSRQRKSKHSLTRTRAWRETSMKKLIISVSKSHRWKTALARITSSLTKKSLLSLINWTINMLPTSKVLSSTMKTKLMPWTMKSLSSRALLKPSKTKSQINCAKNKTWEIIYQTKSIDWTQISNNGRLNTYS